MSLGTNGQLTVKACGTDSCHISASIIVTHSLAHLRALAQTYLQKHKRKLSTGVAFVECPSMAECLMLPLSAAINREFSGHMDEALQFIASSTESDGYGVHRDTDMLEESMKGMGTKDEHLSALGVPHGCLCIFSCPTFFSTVCMCDQQGQEQ